MGHKRDRESGLLVYHKRWGPARSHGLLLLPIGMQFSQSFIERLVFSETVVLTIPVAVFKGDNQLPEQFHSLPILKSRLTDAL